MTSPPRQKKAAAGVAHTLGVVLRPLASLKLAVVLLVVSAVILAWTTVVEAFKGTEYVQWYVYHSRWFIALLAVLATNVLAAILIRFPWKRRHLGFLIAHLGVLVLLGGSLQTFHGGIEGQLPFAEKDTADKIFLTGRSLLKAVLHGEDGPASTEFTFSPGPFDWPEGKTLDFGRAEGIGLEVLGFYRHAREEVSWVADASGVGWPAVEFALNAPGGRTVTRQWLAGSQMGAEVEIGPARFELFTTSAQAMAGDFLDPPLAGAGPSGVVSMCLDDQVFRVDVKENLGKTLPLGETGVSVEIVEYLANAVPGAADRLVSRGTEPRNPMVDLLVHLPGRDEPLRQIALARYPALNLDRAHGRGCPVKFWYYHPAVSAQPGTQFLRAPDGRLYCRVAAGGEYLSRGEVNEGDQIETWVGFSVSLLKYVPHARQQVDFRSLPGTAKENRDAEAAALVEISLDGETEQVWIQRNGQERMLQTPKGLLVLTFGHDRLPLGFSLRLLDFKRGLNPGRVGDASFASSVQLVDSAQGVDETREISMNKPLVHGKFTFYQSSFQELPDGSEVSILSVSHDPGRLLKYLGSLMICVGTFALFYLRGRRKTKETVLSEEMPTPISLDACPKCGEALATRQVGVWVAFFGLLAAVFFVQALFFAVNPPDEDLRLLAFLGILVGLLCAGRAFYWSSRTSVRCASCKYLGVLTGWSTSRPAGQATENQCPNCGAEMTSQKRRYQRFGRVMIILAAGMAIVELARILQQGSVDVDGPISLAVSGVLAWAGFRRLRLNPWFCPQCKSREFR